MEKLKKDQEYDENHKTLIIRALFGDVDAINALKAKNFVRKSVETNIPLSNEMMMLCAKLIGKGIRTNKYLID